jgi:hypothetical protein
MNPAATQQRHEGLGQQRSIYWRSRVDKLGAPSLSWLVVAPVWTDALARSTPFPSGSLPLDDLLSECEAMGWCERRHTKASHRIPSEGAELLAEAATAILRTPSEDTPKIVREVLERLMTFPQEPSVVDASAKLRKEAGRADLAGSAAPLPADDGGPTPPGPAAGNTASSEPEAAPANAGPEPLPVLVERDADGLLREHLADLVMECAREGDPRESARILVKVAPRLSSDTLRESIAVVVSRLPETGGPTQKALGNLATASAVGGSLTYAFELVERLPSGRLRARTLVAMAEAVATTEAAAVDTSRTELSAVLDRLLRALDDGTDVDLPVAADAAERLAIVSASQPVLDLAETALESHPRRGSEVPALVRLASVADAASAPSAEHFASAALEAAQAEGDPAVRCAGLVRVLSVVPVPQRASIAEDALTAARAVIADEERAEALALVAPHLPDPSRGEVFHDLMSLCAPDTSKYSFWVPDATRADLLAILTQHPATPNLRKVAQTAGAAIQDASAKGIPVPPATRRWAKLATRLDQDDVSGAAAGDELIARVMPLLRSGATAEALGWVESANQLLDVVQGSFETSLVLAHRRIEVEQRKEYDRRELRRFLRRQEQIDAFTNLMNSPDDGPWALHFLGHGGVGKSSLLRYLTETEVARDKGLVVARIDFDRLNPEFPQSKPGHLLVELLEELEAHADRASHKLYIEAREKLRHLEWWIEGRNSRDEIERATKRFCMFIEALGRPVVLVLDTCEELTKFQPAGAGLPRLEAAFELIEEIHDKVPSTRAVFAGRRPLALTGAGGWTLKSPGSDSLPKSKDYLAVHEIKGFSRYEAIAYLTTIEGLSLDDDKLDHVLARCVDPHRTSCLNEPEPPATRYNPFDLALYATALRGRPGDIDSLPASDVYVEARVRRRLGDRWGALLPVVVVLRRFDQAMLAAALPDEDAEAAWRELRSTEWVAGTFDRTSRAFFLEIDAGLLERLDAYFTQPGHAGQLEAARQMAAPGLQDLVRQAAAVRELPPDAVEAALRVLPPTAGAQLVDELSLRVAREGAWNWANGVFARVLGPESVLGNAGHPATSAARALFATTIVHQPGQARCIDQWADVAVHAEHHPDVDVARWLRARADLLGQRSDPAAIADAAELGLRLLGHRRGHALWLLGTCLTVIERDPSIHSRATLVDVAGRLRSNELPAVAAMILVLTGHRDDIEQALRLVDQTPSLDPVDAGFLAADWPAPQHIGDRVRLYALNAGMSQEDWMGGALGADLIVDVDADRLAGQLLGCELRRRALRPDELWPAMARVGKHPPPVDTVHMHAKCAPLRVALSRAWLALGDSDRAKQALGPAGRFARDKASQRMLEVSRVDIARRLRLDDVARLKRADLVNLPPSEVPRVIEAVGLLDGSAPRPSASDRPEDVHFLWRAAPRFTCERLDEPLHQWPHVRAALEQCGPGASAIQVGLALDAVESSLLSDTGLPPQQLLGAQTVHSWARAHPEQPEQAVRLLLRAMVLLGAQPDGPHDVEAYSRDPAVGPRRLAELALEEGELLALRLPELGLRLLDESARWFSQAGDRVGEAIAEAAAALAEVRADRSTAADRVHQIRTRLPDMVKAGEADEKAPRPKWDGWLIRLGAATAGSGHAPWRREAPSPELPDWTPPASDRPQLEAEVSPVSIRIQARDLGRAGVERTRRLLFDRSPIASSSYPPTSHPEPSQRAELPGSTVSASEAGPLLDPAVHIPPVPVSEAQESQWSGLTPPVRPQRRVSGALRALAALFIGTVVATSAYLFYNWLERITGYARFVPPLVVQIATFIAVLLAAAFVVIRVLASGPARNYLQLDLVEDGSGYDMAAKGHRQRLWPLPAKRASVRLRVRIEADGKVRHVAPPGDSPGFASYVPPGRPGDPGALSVALSPLRDEDHPLHVGLHTPPHLSDLPWEGFLADLLRGIGPFQIARTRLREGYRSRTLRTWFGARVVVAAPTAWRAFVMSAVPGRPATVVDPAAPGLSPGDIAVILAVPVDTPVGGRLAIPPSRAEETTRDLIIEPDALAPAGAFIVVAGCPTSEHDAAPDVNMRDLRRCGADLIEAGAEFVVVLPSLPADTLHDCLRLLLADVRTSINHRRTRGCAEVVRRLLAPTRPSDACEVTELRAWV